ncbi:flagellar motor switch protein FliN [Patulibacter defluvii]|uniref:flagellar motor switch protein FliN n=1 Tax=Patulibacter defluvii TaxID=3095358 RepID=UPI002A753FC7|nr:flagellar motor switch protein FliN [Patulibacter sp. DM4]
METTDWTPGDELAAPDAPAAPGDPADLARLHDVPVELSVEIGRTRMTLGQALTLGPGSIVELRRQAGEPVDLLAGGKPIARGEVVVIDEEFGLRITAMVVDPAQRQAAAPEAVEEPAEPPFADLAPAAQPAPPDPQADAPAADH